MEDIMSEDTAPTILCVDDDQALLKTTQKMLLKQGYNVLTAGNGVQALEVLSKKTPDLILIDAIMPKMDGYEVCSQLQENPETAYIPVIFVTGQDSDQDKARAFAAGAADHLIKPVEKHALLAKIGLHLRTNERWRMLLQPERTTPWEAPVVPSDFSRFMNFLFTKMSVPEHTRSRLTMMRPAEVYSLTVELGISEVQLAKFIATFCGLSYISDIKPEALQLGVLPATFCKTNHIVVIGTSTGGPAFVVSNPFSWELLDALRIAMGDKQKYQVMITEPDNIDALLVKRSASVSRPSTSMFALEQRLREHHHVGLEDINLHERDEESAPIIELVNRIITSAHEMGASDIHIEPWEKEVIIRYRIDGHLRVANRFRPRSLIGPLVARIKIMSRLDIAERRLPQDGRIVFREYGRNHVDVDLRVSIVPTNYGEKVVMRLLDKKRSILPLFNLGFSERHLEIYKQKITMPYGMILHVGPTGSGKSMTLYAALNEVKRPELNIQTIEDPIEYTLPGIIQLQVNPDIGLTFQRALRSYLRQDPDVILVGEIRDRETAHIAVEAALTGHLLLSTLHTNDAPSTVIRLMEMGIEPFMVSSSIGLVCAQRLIRRLCPQCKEAYQPDAEEQLLVGISEGDTSPLYRPVGCPSCDNIGYRGRIGIHEILVPNDEVRYAINNDTVTAEKLKRMAVESCGMTTLYWDAMEKVRAGICSLGDVLATIRPDDFDTRPAGIQ